MNNDAPTLNTIWGITKKVIVTDKEKSQSMNSVFRDIKAE